MTELRWPCKCHGLPTQGKKKMIILFLYFAPIGQYLYQSLPPSLCVGPSLDNETD